jgi:hypothetical protein
MTLADRARLVTGLAVIITAGVALVPAAARAQSAEAEMLFRDGRNLIKHGKLAAGCDKLAASERLESSIGTLLNVGDCREKLGKLASAWAAFRKAEAMAKRAGGDDKRQGEAGRRAAQLEPRLSNLVIEVDQPVDGLVVRRGGELVDEAQWSTALPVDPGSYTVVAEAPGYQAWQTTVVVGSASAGGPGRDDARRVVVVVPGLEPVAVAPAAAPIVGPASSGAPVEPVVTVRAGTWTGLRKLSVAAAVVGAGALGTGIYLGVHANNMRDRADQVCPLAVCADPVGLDFNDQAKTAARRANILYIAGGGTIATAMVLWLVGAPGETIVQPTGGSHQFGLAISGSF